MPGKLDGKIAVVTGATTGIGLATAELFIAEGAHVVIVGRTGAQNEIAARLGERAVPAHADMTSIADLRKLFDLVADKFGKLDILFNNAGNPGSFEPLVDLDESVIDHVINVNLRAVLISIKYAIPLMVNAGGGSIITTSSSSGFRAEPVHQIVAYAASKGGPIAMTYSLARELGPHNIRVNTICPGPVDTPLFRKHVTDDARKQLSDHTALKRIGRSEEVADVALFFATEASSFVTGTCLPVDGGFIA